MMRLTVAYQEPTEYKYKINGKRGTRAGDRRGDANISGCHH